MKQAIFGILGGVLGVLSVSAPAATTVMRVHHTAPPNHQITMALHEFAIDVAELTQNRVAVDIVTKRTGRPIVEPQNYLQAVKQGEIEAASMPNFMWQSIP